MARGALGIGTRRALVAGLALLAFLSPAQAQTQRIVFGHSGIALNSFAQVGKWTSMTVRHVPERSTMQNPCSPSQGTSCQLYDWWIFLQNLQGASPRQQVDQVNSIMNSVSYIEDIRNYLLSDYWATPGEFFDRNGDCEDYAIAKFMSLRLLGFTNDQLRLVVLQDENLGIPHAVLVVYLDGESLLLDNQISQVVPTSHVRHYSPYYSLNEENVWSHMN